MRCTCVTSVCVCTGYFRKKNSGQFVSRHTRMATLTRMTYVYIVDLNSYVYKIDGNYIDEADVNKRIFGQF